MDDISFSNSTTSNNNFFGPQQNFFKNEIKIKPIKTLLSDMEDIKELQTE